MRIYTPVLLAMACATPAMATPVTWDYVATSCTPEGPGASCGSNTVGSDVAVFTVTPPEDNNYAFTTFGPPSQSGATDFSLTAFDFVAPVAPGTCTLDCSWTVDYNTTSTNPGISDVQFNSLSGGLTYTGNAGWTVSNGVYDIVVAGDWQQANNAVPAPGSSLSWMFVMLWMFAVSCLLRKRV